MANKKIYAIHGFLGSPTDWDFLKKEGLSTTVFSIDLSKQIATDNLSLFEWAKQFNAMVEKQIEPGCHPILMGYSLGGRLALHALIQNPNLWKEAIIISAHTGLQDVEEKQKRLKMDELWALKFENDSWNHLIKEWNEQLLFKKETSLPRKEEHFSRTHLASTLRYWSLGRQENLMLKLNSKSLPPILWIGGSQDAKTVDRYKNIPLTHVKSKVWIAPEAGHRVPWDQSKLFIQTISKFIEEK